MGQFEPPFGAQLNRSADGRGAFEADIEATRPLGCCGSIPDLFGAETKRVTISSRRASMMQPS
jgi:hypothetical protein